MRQIIYTKYFVYVYVALEESAAAWFVGGRLRCILPCFGRGVFALGWRTFIQNDKTACERLLPFFSLK